MDSLDLSSSQDSRSDWSRSLARTTHTWDDARVKKQLEHANTDNTFTRTRWAHLCLIDARFETVVFGIQDPLVVLSVAVPHLQRPPGLFAIGTAPVV